MSGSTINQEVSSFHIRPLKELNLQELKRVEKLYKESFPDEERKSFSMILFGEENKVMDTFTFFREGELVALAFLIRGKKADILDYLAVDPAYQNQGIGSFVLKTLIQQQYRPLIVEIEKEDPNKEYTSRRKRFYLQNGFTDNRILINLFGVDMELLSTSPITFSRYYEVFEDYMKPFSFARKWDLKSKIIHKNRS